MNKISIIIVTYNAEKDLQACLDSIKQQTYSPLEVVIVDGASTDGTLDIIKQNPDVVSKWISEKDNGIYDAMNKALKMITGDWVYFIGADDTLLPDFDKMAKVLKDPNTIYYGSVLARGGKYLGHLTPYSQAKTGICHQAMIYPKIVFDKYTFDPRFRISADHHLNMKCYADPAINIEFVDYIIANFNHTGISSVQKDALFEKQKAQLILKYFGVKIWARFVFKLLKWKLLNRKEPNRAD
ncbi:glycosyltransferase family 2 protein [Pedobacter gandavensis]|uniref:glycosyltransferase family 2 protein n=1 Tax=Pedobacter gandavensis TaxID=2679963 RepID=UPI00292E10F7|nr:glycosyltransferase family 2 protein [Pedobacter gandavensis]